MQNMQVANPTTPASLYHMLRRQMHQLFRKPLVIMSPKSLLRHKLAVSDLAELADGTKCTLVIGEQDASIKAQNVKTCVLCSGKVYYDLYEKRAQLGRDDVAIIRLEQLYPFPEAEVATELKKYKGAKIVWCQEEHKNMGAYTFVAPLLTKVLQAVKSSASVEYAGRPSSASPAVGYMKLHVEEHERLLKEIFG
jgi:2-oxoglutarate dehydrogenase E1 component